MKFKFPNDNVNTQPEHTENLKPDCRHNSVKTLVIYGKAQGSATPFCVTDAVKWARDLRNRICCPVVFALNTKQACGGTIPKRAPFNQSKTSKYK